MERKYPPYEGEKINGMFKVGGYWSQGKGDILRDEEGRGLTLSELFK